MNKRLTISKSITHRVKKSAAAKKKVTPGPAGAIEANILP